ncbi:MAG: hypothetical protein HKN31_15965 [Pricia sp.]|nr:hypothetical protein [Pricia sp.]
MEEQTRNPFKELDERIQEVPPGMKKKVMQDVAIAKLVMELSSLFTFNYKSIIEGLFKTRTKI